MQRKTQPTTAFAGGTFDDEIVTIAGLKELVVELR
jgi:hypothetical protein